jgi:hypothetical protein
MILARCCRIVPPFDRSASLSDGRQSRLLSMALREKPGVLHGTFGIVAAGFLGMFVCGGPVLRRRCYDLGDQPR